MAYLWRTILQFKVFERVKNYVIEKAVKRMVVGDEERKFPGGMKDGGWQIYSTTMHPLQFMHPL